MLQVRLLGQFDLRADGRRIVISSRAGQSLLAYLVLTAGTSHRREKLAGHFWPDTTDENARKNLRQELWRIRKAIPTDPTSTAEFLSADEFTVSFNPDSDHWLDVAQMEKAGSDLESLTSGLSLYQGELLPGFYEDWIVLERERIQTVFENRMDQLIQGLVAADRWVAVQEQSERWLALGNSPEAAYRALMLSYSVRGDMAKVGSAYQRCVDELREQFGVEPSPETQALYRGLLKGAGSPHRNVAARPSSTITFLFTDIEGSTRLLDTLGSQYAVALAEHHEIMRKSVRKWNGQEVDTQGDAFFVTFTRALDAIQCASEAQRALAEHEWPGGQSLRVRMGLHTGEPLIASTGYVGMDVHRAARIGDAGHGGQVLISQTTRDLVSQDLPEGMLLRSLGDHRLKDMKYPTPIYQLLIAGLPEEFPPLKLKFTGTEPPAPGEPPFKGLQFFDEDDAVLFYGRELLTSKLVKQLYDAHVLSVIIGASGSGKSSLVRAGMIPALRSGTVAGNGKPAFRGDTQTQFHIITPTAHPLQALATELTRNSESITAGATLMDDLAKEPRSLALFLARQVPARPVVLAIDQFEELFTLCREDFEREAFIDNLITAISVASNGTRAAHTPNLTLIITLRADFYAHLAQYPELRDLIAREQEYIGPMSAEELRRAIEEPARHGHWEFEPGLVDLILRDVGAEPGALPLLSHALLETWKRRAGHTLTLKGYADAGGVRGAIAHTADTVFHKLGSEEQALARDIFLRLTELGEGTEDTRRRAAFDELISPAENAESIRRVLNTLAEARLITLGENTAEVAHEALIREWPTLREWLNQGREGLRLHRHLTEAAHDWELLERDPGALYRGMHLAQAEHWDALNPHALNAGERTFLQASIEHQRYEEIEREAQRQRELAAAHQLAETERARAEEQARAARRMRNRNQVVTIVGIVALIFGMLALVFGSRSSQHAAQAELNLEAALTAESHMLAEKARADQERDLALAAQAISQSRELASAARNNLTADPERSVLLAIHGLSLAHTREAEEALHESVLGLRTVLALQHPDVVGSVSYNPDGKRILTTSDDGVARVWDVHTGQQVLEFQRHSGGVNDATYSPDGKRIATAGEDNTVRIWDAESGQELLVLRGHTDFAFAVKFSPDGQLLATGGGDAALRIWDASTGDEIRTLRGYSFFVHALAFSPDGSRLAGSSGNELIMWDVSTGDQLLKIDEDAQSMAFSPDGRQLAFSKGNGGTLKILDAVTGTQLLQMAGHANQVMELDYDPDSLLLASASLDGTVRIWDSVNGQTVLVLPGDDGLSSVDFSPDGRFVATGGWDNTARIWDVTPSGSKEILTLSGRRFHAVNFSPDHTRIATGSEDDGILQIWSSQSGAEVLRLDAHAERITRAVFSPEGSRIASSSADNSVKVWDSRTGRQLLLITGHGEGSVGLFSGVLDVSFSPNGRRLATAGADGVAKVWDATTGRELLVLAGSEFGLTSIQFSSDGRLIAAGSGSVGNPETSARIWDAATGKLLQVLSTQQQRIWSVAFDPSGDRLVTAGSGGIIKVWDVETGRELMNIPDFVGTALEAVFSPDGARVAIAGADGLHVWDLSVNRKLLELHPHLGIISGLSFTSDWSRVATASLDGTTMVIYAEWPELLEHAKSRVSRSLTEAECQQYLHVLPCPVAP